MDAADQFAAARAPAPGRGAHRRDDIVPIPGTKRRTYLEENVAAADVRLTPDEMATLDAALAPEKVSGPRYAPAQMAQVDR